MKINIDIADYNDLADDEIFNKTLNQYIGKVSCHIGILRDKIRAEINRGRYRNICEKCGGTGNQLYSMYQKCYNCDGNGYK